MAIGLYDGTAYIIEKDERMDWNTLLLFFLNGHMEDVLILHDEKNRYCGMVTYKSILKSHSVEGAVICDKLILDQKEDLEQFWKRAQRLLANSDENMLPVFNKKMELMYFAQYNQDLFSIECEFEEMSKHTDGNLWKNFKEFNKHIHIVGMNDILYFFRNWLVSIGAGVSVEGELWELMGYEVTSDAGGDVLIADETCGLVHALCTEYADLLVESMQGEASELIRLLHQPFVPDAKRKKVMFHLTAYSYFAESILPLLYYYLKHEKECVVVFGSVLSMLGPGKDHACKITRMVKQIETLGGKCYSEQVGEVWQQEFSVCYLCSEYSGILPSVKAEFIAAVQTTAIYTHAYIRKGHVQALFSEWVRNKIDYLIISEYIAGWISERSHGWEEKILKFGYPKMDALYDSLANPIGIPEEWMKRTEGKKVILIMVEPISQVWLDFAENRDDIIVIWRPHPYLAEQLWLKREIEEAEQRRNVIIDRELSYYASFWLSDALLTKTFASAMINYLYLDKPICVLDSEQDFEEAAMNYRQEMWYKSADNAFGDDDVLRFFQKIISEENTRNEEQEGYRRQVISGFDGRVCSRIFNYFEEKAFVEQRQ